MAEQELNKLNVKSDSLPDNWLVTLVNPVTGAVAENMTVARFIELITSKMPIATNDSKGLLSNIQFNNMMSKDDFFPMDANELSKTSYNINTLENLPNWRNYKNYPDGYGVFVVYGNGYFVVQISYNAFGESKRRIRVSPDINNWTPWVNC